MESNRLRQIKMRHVVAFVDTLRGGSLKAAAERNRLTQPAVSKTLKDLERILGVALLRRDRGGIDLTREGAAFRPFAEQSLLALSHGLSTLDALERGTETALVIGALPSVAADLLPEAVLQFAELSPGCPVSVEDGQIGTLIDRLRSGELDLLVGRMGTPEMMTGLSFTQLYWENVVFVAAADHPCAGVSDVRALAGETLIYPPPGAAIRSLVDRFMISLGLSGRSDRLESVSGAFGRAMTLGPARAIWIISQGVVAGDIAAGRLVALPIDTSPMAGPVGIMARSEEPPTPTMQLFRQVLHDATRRAGRRSPGASDAPSDGDVERA